MTQTQDLIGVAEAARLLHVSVRTIHRKIKAGEIVALKLGMNTSAYAIERSEVDRIERERLARYASAAPPPERQAS